MSGGWHQGVIGIVAGRLKERFGRPAIVIAECEDGTGKGSGRSISGVDLGAAVLAAKDSGLLVAGGGHAMAAGLTACRRAGSSRSAHFINERLAADVEQLARRPRTAARRAARAGRSRGGPVRRARRRRPLWRGLARAARRRRPGAAAEDRRRRRWPCPRDRRGRRRQELQVHRLSQPPPRRLGQALLAVAADRRWWLAGTIKRDEWNGGNAAEMHVEDAALA